MSTLWCKIQKIFSETLVIGVLSLILFVSLTYNLMVFTESRSYIVHRGWIEGFSLSYFFFPVGINARLMSMLVSAFQNSLFGVDIFFANLIQSIILSLCAIVGFLHIHQLTNDRKISAFIIFLWCFSGPVLAASLWQSTQHDKLAMFFTISVLVVNHFALSKKRSWAMVVACSFSSFFLTIFAFNSKEVSFILPFTSIALLLHLFGKRENFNWKRACVLFLPQLVFSSSFIISYALNLDDGWKNHIQGGNAINGIKTLFLLSLNLGDFLGLGQWGEFNALLKRFAVYGYSLFFALLISVGFVAVILKVKRESIYSVIKKCSTEIYFLTITFFVFLTAARTSYPSAFYLVIASWSGSAFLVLLCQSISRCFAKRRAIFFLLMFSFFVPYFGSYLSHFIEGGAFVRLKNASINIQNSFFVVRQFINSSKIKQLTISIPENNSVEWFIFSDNAHKGVDQDLAPFLFGDLECKPIVKFLKTSTSPTISESGLLVELDNDLHLLNFEYNGESICKPIR